MVRCRTQHEYSDGTSLSKMTIGLDCRPRRNSIKGWRRKIFFDEHEEHHFSISQQLLDRLTTEPNLMHGVITGIIYSNTFLKQSDKVHTMSLSHLESPVFFGFRRIVHEEFIPQGQTDIAGLLLHEFPEPRTAINSGRYCETQKLNTAIGGKGQGERVQLLHDGTRFPMSSQTELGLAQ
ncbi:hypothetical protein Trydic_g10453 [Trypoxylus dichotomus]